MEGCPKTLMISFDTKESAPADFNQAISNYIQEFYQEDPSSYENEIQQINQLKKSTFSVTKDNQGCSHLRRYYAQLQFLQSRFPMGEGGAAAMPFSWYDVYCGEPMTHKDIRYEQACVLFNLDVISMSSCIATSRLVHNGGYIQKLLQLFSSHEILRFGRLYVVTQSERSSKHTESMLVILSRGIVAHCLKLLPNVLYRTTHLGGVYSQLGANESRITDESMKIACTYFQCAAGAFDYLKENFMLDSLPDMGGDILQIKATVMLGQAQECLLEKSIRDGRKNALIARIAVQIRDYFQETVKLLEGSGAEEMGSTLRKSWAKHLKIKILMYTAIAYIYMSNESDHNEKFGEKVAYLKGAIDKMNEAMKLSKNQPNQVLETLKFVMDVVGNKYDGAKRDNDFVYHEMVPELDKLSEIKGVSLVKAMPFQYNDPTVSGPDIFQRLIPMKAHEASSLYSEEKAKVLRQINGEIESKDIQLTLIWKTHYLGDQNPSDGYNFRAHCTVWEYRLHRK